MELFLIFVGWLLGLCSPLVSEWLQQPQRANQLIRAIKSETEDTRYRLASQAFLLTTKHGRPDREFIKWSIKTLRKYDGPEKQIDLKPLDNIESLSDSQFNSLWKQLAPASGIGAGLKTLPTSFLDMIINRIHELPLDFQAQLHTIKYQLSTINQQIQDTKTLHNMTFDSALSSANHDRIKAQIFQNYRNISQQSRLTVDHIDVLLEMKEPRFLDGLRIN